jgi:DNA-directed RNA polymerase
MAALNTIEDAKNHVLWADQDALEQEMRSLGIENYRKNAEKAKEKGQETRVAPVRRLMQDAHHKMVEALSAFYADVESRKAGRKHSAYAYIHPMDIDVVAHLTCRVVLDMAAQRKTLTHLSVILGEALEDECNYRHFAKEHIAGYKAAAKRIEKTKHQGHIRRSVKASAGKLGVNLLEWPKRDMVLVGSKLIEMFTDATKLVTLHKTQEKIAVEMTAEARAWIEREGKTCELLAPTYMPTVIPPKPWTNPFDGGYWTGRAKRLKLIKTGDRAHLEELANQEMPEVYDALNALQDTPWHVNAKVLDVMSTLWDEQSTTGVIPLVDPQPLPNKPVWLTPEMKKENMDEAQLEAFKKWKGDCAVVYEKNAEEEGRRQSFLRMLWVADKFKNRNEFFYPYALDFRGRAYPVGLYLQPQGNDAQRGLLEFSEECPINDQEAANWLMIHGAGLWGVDKVSFEERCAWVESNEAAILASAENPYENRFWMTAEDGDKCWQALAFCFDYAGFKATGFGYLSALPVQMDGTCNGIQNFSAMLLDERGGAAVNLVPADKPQDIYTEVKDEVIKRVLRDAADGNDVAAMWVGQVTRKVCKRPVMTLAYGAKRFGFTDMVMVDTMRPAQKKNPEAFGGKRAFEAAQYMGGCIWEAVQEVVVAAASAMKWLQEVANIVSKEDLPIYWRAPTGLLVKQEYKLRKLKKIEVMFQNVLIAPRIDGGSDKLDTRKQASGIAPNWVHSLDASHMMKTICAATHAGVHSFSFIHDSYGTHAGNTALLATTLREQFVAMYSGCVLQQFADDLKTMLPEGVELPPVPAKGSLDLSKVLESQFFFA